MIILSGEPPQILLIAIYSVIFSSNYVTLHNWIILIDLKVHNINQVFMYMTEYPEI